ncbi:hypothetical protein BjapCC829_19340 [Bradyrhizobium barranii]|uniref:Uncharacterized protein n=1 Tax=Bradyrhizobium barranii TaxID=2992140 RepID=A0ABY3QZS1_9BRAD|nr:hypothetical protein [Bradyrhizobium japonicum]UFW90567.1 hypothetical protein BjapCC829_19340 [Bradyrhizobium japonicum]
MAVDQATFPRALFAADHRRSISFCHVAAKPFKPGRFNPKARRIASRSASSARRAEVPVPKTTHNAEDL